jgi:hypothetical protein
MSMRKSTIVGSWKRLGLERLIHRRRDGLFLMPLDRSVAGGRLASSDGLARIVDQVRSFLASGHIDLLDGTIDNPVHAETVHGLGNGKNELVLARIRHDDVEAYEGSARYLDGAQRAGLHRSGVSSTGNCCNVRVAAGIEHLFEVGIDAKVAAERRLSGRPALDTRVVATKELGVSPDGAAVFNVALVGAASGRARYPGCAVSVEGVGQADVVRSSGADLVVVDLVGRP